MHLALPSGHKLAERQVVALAELSDEEWLCGSGASSCGEVVIRACRDAGFEPKVGFWSDDYGVMQGFISAGLGFTLCPTWPCRRCATISSSARPIRPRPSAGSGP